MQKQKPRHNSAALPCPHEAAEQRNIFEWAGLMRRAHPELQLLYHVPNEGKRTWRTGARLKSEGLKPGVPDICLPVARGKYHGLYVELKRRDQRASRVRDSQRWWLVELGVQGYHAQVCYGAEDAQGVILRYLALEDGKAMQV